MDNQALNEAIEILINNVARNPRLNSLDSSSSLNVFDLLQEFWQMKLNGTLSTANTALMFNELENAASSSNHSSAAHLFFNSTLKSLNKASASSCTNNTNSGLILYEFLEKPDPPYVCFVTLPNGSCFASFQNASTKLEARKSAGLIALMNSIFNEHPLRKISDEFIKKSLESAQREMACKQQQQTSTSLITLDLYRRMLEMCVNKTMLEFKHTMTVFQLLQWNGSLKAMRDRDCSLEEVISHYKNFKIDETMRNEMSIDWMAREQTQPGLILNELKRVNQEIDDARLRGQELRFLKEKRDILLLASFQFDMEINSIC